MEDDTFLGMETVDQFEEKLKQFSTSQRFSRRLQRYPLQQILKRSNSFAQSQVSTAINSSAHASRKQTPTENIVPKRRHCEIYTGEAASSHFAEKVEYLASQCNDQSDLVIKELNRVAQEFGVSLTRIQQFNTQQERENYILLQLSGQVMDSLKQWKSKVDQRELLRKKNVEVTIVKNNQEKMLEIFDWIEIDTKFRQLKKRLKFALVEMINDKNNTNTIHMSLSHRSGETIQDLLYKKPDTRQIIDELTNLLKTIKNKKNTPPPVLSSPVKVEKWNLSKEEIFISKRTSAKQRLSKLINSSSWNNVAMGEFVSNLDKGQQNKQQREELERKLETYQPMSEDDLLYLINTSVLLNRCADKRFIQNAINHLDKDIISDIELQIAENILKSHFEISKQVKHQRHEFLKERNEAQFQKNRQAKNLQENFEKKTTIRKLQIKMCNLLREMNQKTKTTMKQDSEKYNLYYQEYKAGNPIANPYVWKFKEVMMNVIKRKKLERRDEKFGLRAEINKPIFPSKSDDALLTLKAVIRKTHAPSKLQITPSAEDCLMTPAKVISEYKLKVQKKGFEKDQANFKSFYTGGPKLMRKYASPILSLIEGETKSNWITPEIEVIAINRIKRALKAYIAKKRFTKERERKRMQEYQEKERDPKFFRILSKMRSKNYSAVDVEECYKSLKQAIAQSAGSNKQQQVNKKMDYSKVKVPHSMIQLKLKQRKLFLALKVGNTNWGEYSGFEFDASDVNCYDVDMFCPLYHAATLQSITFCNFLINAGADVNMPCKEGTTPTFAAFATNNVTLINQFISNGADLDIINDEGKNPLCYCSIAILQELNLQYNPVNSRSQTHRQKSRRTQSKLEHNYSPYAEMKMEPLLDGNDEIRWQNDQIVSLRTFYTKKERNEYVYLKQKVNQIKLLENQSKDQGTETNE